jgi:hypothetical protein
MSLFNNKYIIEENINFYDELYKSLDEDDDTKNNDENICLITGLPLTDNFVTLECNHKFNYNALYKEIYQQKIVFRTYTMDLLTKEQIELFKNSGKKYYIKCPYCRNIQFTLLPYYNNLNYSKLYGINSDSDSDSYTYHSTYTFMKWGYTFSHGKCEKINNNGTQCNGYYCATLPETNKTYCQRHIRLALREYKKEEIKKQKEEVKKQKEEAKKQKEEAKKQKEEAKKQKEEDKKQKEEAKNLIICNNIVIQNSNNNNCDAILKYGTNKGQKCGAKIFENNLCKRHNKITSK